VERCLACEADTVGTVEGNSIGACFDRSRLSTLSLARLEKVKPPKDFGVDRRLPRITQRDIFNSLTLFNRAPESKRSRASLIFLSDASTVLI